MEDREGRTPGIIGETGKEGRIQLKGVDLRVIGTRNPLQREELLER